MKANKARTIADDRRDNDKASIPARIYSRIQDRATNGKNFLLCRSNKQVRQQLKTDGYGIILLGLITLIRW